MGKLAETGAAVQHLAKQYAAVIELGKAFEALGSLEQHEAELSAKLATLRDQVDTVQSDLNLALTAKSDAARETQQIIADAEAECKRLIEVARGDRAQIIDEAKAEAAAIHEAAVHKATEAQLRLEEKYSELQGLDLAIDAKLKELERINAAIAEARAKLGV